MAWKIDFYIIRYLFVLFIKMYICVHLCSNAYIIYAVLPLLNWLQEELEDLRRRIKDGSLKRPTVVSVLLRLLYIDLTCLDPSMVKVRHSLNIAAAQFCVTIAIHTGRGNIYCE